MSHAATVTTTARRTFGLARVVHIIRCRSCGYRMECDNLHTASVFMRRHNSYGGRA